MSREFLAGRHTAELEGDFVVFLIGARIDRRHPLRSVRDLGGRRGMGHMLSYLASRPEKGLLGFEMGFPTIVQYWRSFEHLEAFAKDRDDPHLAVWRDYNRRVAANGSSAGIWHETYLVRAGEHESIYANVAARGLGRAGRTVPISSVSAARNRLGRKGKTE